MNAVINVPVLLNSRRNQNDTQHRSGYPPLMEIILPWHRFNGHPSSLIFPDFGGVHDRAMEIAARVHPAWNNCNDAVRRLHARNVLQILGTNLDSPVDVVICWTPGGKPIGGTATGIAIAREKSIPIINLGDLGKSFEYLNDAQIQDLHEVLEIISPEGF